MAGRPVSFAALGTTVQIVTADPTRSVAAVAAVMREVDDLDRGCSRFRRDSDLEAVNNAAGSWCSVGPVLIGALEVALHAARLTDGDVDPTVGPALEAIGYDRDFASMELSGAGSPPIPAGRWREVEVDAEEWRVRIPAGTSLDLGATAKAWCADRSAAAAHQAAGCGVLVSLGGDLAVAGPPPGEGWTVGVADSHADDPSGDADIRIFDGGVATSSTTVRRWTREGASVHHIVDPSTGRSAEEVWRTVTVAAASCADANVASTASIVRGEEALAWLEAKRLPARLVRASGAVVTTSRWPVRTAA